MTTDTSAGLPRVTLVTPAYNQAEYLAETIDSVLAQDYPNLEYIVLDDGSTDATPQVLQGYDGRVRWERQANMGQARTLNRGWQMARGELVGYLSSDDRLEPDAISRLVAALQADAGAVVAYGDFLLIDAQGRPFRTVQAEDFDAHRLTVDLVCQPGPGALFRRRILDEAGGWKDHLRQVPDFEFWLRACRLGRFVRVPRVLAHYRVHEGSASFRPTSPERSDEIVEVMQAYWRADDPPGPRRRSLARAHVTAARSHLQSGRPLAGLAQWWRGVRQHTGVLRAGWAWRALASGSLRRLAYRLQGRHR